MTAFQCDRAANRLWRIAAGIVVGAVVVLANQSAHALVELDGIAAITAGGQHTCAVTTAGGAKCWGDNQRGQLGDNSTTQRSLPVDVSGLAAGVAAIAGGRDHTCALTTTGFVKCWGDNFYGQLGDYSTTTRLAPVDVSGLGGGVAAISAGTLHTCALTKAGGVKCWGYFYTAFPADLGWDRLLIEQRGPPVDISGLESGVTAIAAGDGYNCALTTSGGVKCGGSVLIDVPGLGSGAAAISIGGWHACVLTSGGGVKCFNAPDRKGLVDVPGLGSGIAAIATGTQCAITIAGGVKCWADDNSVPVDVVGLASGVLAIVSGGSHICALTKGGGVMCWGNNMYGELGDNSGTRHAPADVSGLGSGVAAISAWWWQTCALTTSGGVKCWGSGFALTPVDVLAPGSGVVAIAGNCALTAAGGVKCGSVDVPGLGNAVAVTAGGCALTTSGSVKCFNGSGVVDVPGLESGIAAIATGETQTCVLTTGGGVKCLSSVNGALVDVPSLGSGIVAITVGGRHACALATSGGVKCWGDNTAGQLGDHSTAQRLAPVEVSGLAGGVAAIAAGRYHTCALTTGGGVKCWGANESGQLGDNSSFSRSTPVDVSGLSSGVAAISAGALHTCAVTTGGAAKCWGYHQDGEIGDGSGNRRAYPAPVLTTSARENYTALWWNPAESGWGINFNHQGDLVFATLFTYAADGVAMWLSAAMQLQSDGSYSGDLFRSTGTPFSQVPFAGSTATKVGTMTIRFSSATRGTLQYTVDGVGVQKSIEPQVFASPVPTCSFTTASRAGESNYQDLWWIPSESGWGINFTHQGNVIFATLFIYTSTGRDGWLTAPMFRQPDGSYTGTLGANNGPAFNANPWTPVQFTALGTMTVRFISGDRAVLDYTVLGTNVTKNIQREIFGSSVPVCR